MPAIAIRHVAARYHLPATAGRDRVRLQGLLRHALVNALDDALDRAGLPRDSHVCLRQVRAAAAVSLRESDRSLEVRLADAIAAAIVGAAREESPVVVVYRSRAEALRELTAAAAAGRCERSWAWRQMGLWTADAAVPAGLAAPRVLDALTGNPTLATSVLAHVARHDAAAFAALVCRATSGQWRALAAAVAAIMTGGRATDARSSELAPQGPVPVVGRALDRSAIVAAARHLPTSIPGDTLRALALLALFEVEPGWASDDVRPVTMAAARLAHAVAVKRAGARSVSASSPAPVGDDPRTVAATQSVPLSPPAHGQQPLTEVARTTTTEADVASSRPAHSRVGGVLYLLNLLAGLELPQVLAVDRRLAGRGLRWTLHHLAMFLTGGAADDAAVLAFAGVAPTGPLPWLQPDAVTDDEQAAVAECAATVVRELRLRLPIEGTDAELLAQVCQRPVEMTCDPGWIDVRFRLEDVSIDIRRAGLDRDPGWLPWLGVVLRFRYA